ncbi:MAG: tRNA (N6-isopentenyl adenosine(37)-C2)-methylthiotransferase MiaB [Sphaerospermopsis sp. SIO1G2]|nr:tRNA (N6-isopentenyl adenosine(37)-C2)-methylthiotransferase MiaB [Sphaerospermopsis sp. SIO1G2]
MTMTHYTARKLYIKTWGCQMNVYDSQRMEDVLRPHGYVTTHQQEEADLIILNTCHIREKAAEKVYSELGRLRQEKERRATSGKETLIAVGGCVGQAEGNEILRRAPYVDMVFGPQTYHHLPRMIREVQQQQRGVVELEFPQVQKFDLLPAAGIVEGASAFVSVQEGCDKFCSFCVVPYTRGAEYSRPVQAVLDDVRRLVEERGVLEVTLLGQNVNAYHGEEAGGRSASLAELIARLAEIHGLKRIRYTTSHPQDMRDDLIDAHGEIPALMPYLHLPVQSGSDRILKAMNRRHSAADYIEMMERLRAKRPDIAFSGDFIVGFPGETEEDFISTMRVVETVGYASAYSFKYSPRPGTPAALMDAQVPEEVKSSRLALLQGLLNRQQRAFNEASIGVECDVLLERNGKHDGQMIGRSPWMQSVHVSGVSGLVNQLVRVRITDAHANSLSGELVQHQAAA